MTESKTELLGWLNDLLSLNYSSIEQCGSGSAFCQIIDSIYGTVPITRIKFDTKNEYDYVSNYKILQAVFNKHKIERNIPIDKLIKCRYSDNLEFLQWMKKYWDAFYPGGGYNAHARREIAMKAQLRTHTAKSPTSPSLPNQLRSSVKSLQGSPTGKQSLESREWGSRPSSSKARNVEQDRKVSDLQRQVNELRAAADTLERERNFYYLKLRDLEAHVLEKMEVRISSFSWTSTQPNQNLH
ncbi:RP/EB family microtubule-associated protein [Chytriomyces cf. hyalinus JEL632]|nr:RP/EB family microtubule-associated protein [Chytriomyces cf. hyalinus JEL632]